MRYLYSASALGINGYVNRRVKLKNEFHNVENNFKVKMNEFADCVSNSMIYTEDLKHMIHLTDNIDSDLALVKKMILKFSEQNSEMRFGSFVFGPVVMRMYHHLNQPMEALELFKTLENNGFFDQLVSYQIIMDLLLVNGYYQEVINVFEIVKRKQLKSFKYPKNAVVLVLAACYKLNDEKSYTYAKQLWLELNKVGHYPMRRAVTFTAALAIQNEEPQIALEILTIVPTHSYVTVRNLKVSALVDLKRFDDALRILRSVLETDKPRGNKDTLCEEVITKLCGAIRQLERPELTEEFERIETKLQNGNHISSTPLSDLLCSDISVFNSLEPHSNSQTVSHSLHKSKGPYRPGLQDLC